MRDMLTRRHLLGGLTLLPALAAGPAAGWAQSPLTLATAGKGSAFLPYGEGIAAHLARAGIQVAVRETAGSNENLGLVEASPGTLATVFLGSAYDAVAGTGWAAGRRHCNVRALFPMYETSFQIVVRRGSGQESLARLDGRSVGVGPAGGPAEVYFRAAAEATGIRAEVVNGAPAALVERMAAGSLDALWQGAVVPIPALVSLLQKMDGTVIGLDDTVIDAMLRRFPPLARAVVPPGTYAGQTAALASVAAWNFVLAHADLPEATAYALTRAVLQAADPAAAIHPSAVGTRAANAGANRFLPFHPGAARFYREAGVALAAP